MSFDLEQFSKTSQPLLGFTGWIVFLLSLLYFIFGWLTFALFSTALLVKSTAAGSARPLVEITGSLNPYVLSVGAFVFGALLFGTAVASLLFKALFAGLFYRRFVHARSAALKFLGFSGGLLSEAQSFSFFSVVSGVSSSLLAAIALGNAFTFFTFMLLPVLWLFPAFDSVVGSLLDAHPFASYLFIHSQAGFVFSLLLLPFLFFWGLFVNRMSIWWLRVVLAIVAYAYYRRVLVSTADIIWISASRARTIFRSSFSLTSPYPSAIFYIQSIVVQKASSHEAWRNSVYFTDVYIPPTAHDLLFKGTLKRMAIVMCIFGAGVAWLAGFLFVFSLPFFLAAALVIFLFCIVPFLASFGSAGVYFRTILYGWILDQEFSGKEKGHIPEFLDPIFHELHTKKLGELPAATRGTENFSPIPPEN